MVDSIEVKQILGGLKEMRGYWKLNEEAQDPSLWRTCFGRGEGPVLRLTADEWMNTYIFMCVCGLDRDLQNCWMLHVTCTLNYIVYPWTEAVKQQHFVWKCCIIISWGNHNAESTIILHTGCWLIRGDKTQGYKLFIIVIYCWIILKLRTVTNFQRQKIVWTCLIWTRCPWKLLSSHFTLWLSGSKKKHQHFIYSWHTPLHNVALCWTPTLLV